MILNTTTTQDIEELERFLLESIPLARAMQLRLLGVDNDGLRVRAPLAPNINDKGCAFGGSLSGLMTLAGWALVVLALKARNEEVDVFVARSEIRYLQPLFDDLEISARLAADADWDGFLHALAQRGKARICIESEVHGSDGPASVQTAYFVAKRRTADKNPAQ